MMLYINYPSWIHPEVFHSVPFLSAIRWYGVMYVLAFSVAYYVLKRVRNEGAFGIGKKISDEMLSSFISWGIAGLLLGARIGSVLIYDTSSLYLRKPWLIFWFYDEAGNFTGLQGMSYHGGFVGGLIGMLAWCRLKKEKPLVWIDAMAASIPLGYTFGRLGNFANGELYGRITTVPWGIVFPNATPFPTYFEWVKSFCEKINMTVPNNSFFVNLPRHPSQLYEAFFEGIFLWAILFLLRKWKGKWTGLLTGAYVTGYGLIRFIIEYFREPDADLGFRFARDPLSPIYLNTSIFNISTGQVLCLIMIILGIIFMLSTYFMSKRRNKKV